MARGDRTGPEGRGPLTGRGLGDCAGNDETGDITTGGFFRRVGRGVFGRGRNVGTGSGAGMGRGRNRRTK